MHTQIKSFGINSADFFSWQPQFSCNSYSVILRSNSLLKSLLLPLTGWCCYSESLTPYKKQFLLTWQDFRERLVFLVTTRSYENCCQTLATPASASQWQKQAFSRFKFYNCSCPKGWHRSCCGHVTAASCRDPLEQTFRYYESFSHQNM